MRGLAGLEREWVVGESIRCRPDSLEADVVEVERHRSALAPERKAGPALDARQVLVLQLDGVLLPLLRQRHLVELSLGRVVIALVATDDPEEEIHHLTASAARP